MTLGGAIQTSAARAGAIGVVQVWAQTPQQLDCWLDESGLGPCGIGALVLRDLLGVDRGIVARWGGRSVHLMPHGGIAVMRRLSAALQHSGVEVGAIPSSSAEFPEARDDIEARTLAALARAPSPLAVDLLLDQPRRHASGLEPDSAHSSVLDRLIDPPLVVAVGPTNVGKSTLMNALAGRPVSIVGDEPGTTRDHIGVAIDLGGLVVRFVDTPGQLADRGEVEAQAAVLAGEVVGMADLVLCCADAGCAAPDRAGGASLVVATRVDLGKPAWGRDAEVSVTTGAGLGELVALVRDTLVPPGVLADPRPWLPGVSRDTSAT
ncbi:hypothetical protein DRQ53_15910 [bacterium]|nr:MAG: hypothetical protein DRQ53_15910 [bacterium]